MTTAFDVTLDKLTRQEPSGAVPAWPKPPAGPPSSGTFVGPFGGILAPFVGSAAMILVAPAGLVGMPSPRALHYFPSAVVQDAVVDRRRRDHEDGRPVSYPQGSVALSTNQSTDSARPISVAEEITAADHLFAIQNAFSLSVTQLAEVIGVSRGTVYSWMKGTVDLPRKELTEARLHEVLELAKEWRRRSAGTLGRLIEAPVTQKRESLVALLSANALNHSAIHEVFDVLAKRLDAKALDRRTAAENSPDSVREITAENIEIERLRLRGLGA